MNKIVIENHNGVNVLRDDLLSGGTKSVLMPHIVGDAEEYVYASPVYGAFQIALAIYCKDNNKKATIFCAKRKERHENTVLTEESGAKIMEIPYGYLSVVEARAREYCKETGAQKLDFGGDTAACRLLLMKRMSKIIKKLGKEPDEIWVSVGSGTLISSILMATDKAKIHGVVVGADCKLAHERLTLWQYPKSFAVASKVEAPFKSMPNYDLKAWEYCVKHKTKKGDVLFWNVY